ncbi:hypothetical protein G8759_20015 [Spirosoma aureum]|uniref:Uncharacterized protein n=1 Tax=Spirosoma aureum TaxID=2692134 RepID=A0A6G9AQT8_9BACT|nr:hypothetical protein [Spirosoma aureum]QIP14738.1 hypothetical protein G8759_20015 [Spirosoma aureum]
MNYFIRISHQNNPANRLQEYILKLVEKYDHLLCEDAETIFTQVEQLVSQANRAYPRCTAQKAQASHDHKSKTLNSFHVGGLFTMSVHKVAGQHPKPTDHPPAQPAQALPLSPAEEQPATSQPRQAILKSREDDTIIRLEFWNRFSSRTQTLLTKGVIWNIYYDASKNIVAEEFGGQIHPAF